jgi:hypothetical protein
VKFKREKLKRAAVLGCGPAGLFATHALVEKGWQVTVYSKRRKSHMFGAQYLHRAIPGLTKSDPVEVEYALLGGTPEEYREKIYGPNQVTTSVQILNNNHQAWDIREAYDEAWERYSHLVIEADVTSKWLGIHSWEERAEPLTPVGLASHQYDVVISSIPMDQLCYQQHEFHSTSIWAIGDAPERGTYAPYRAPENTIQCSASPDVGWYRASNVFSHVTVEWPGRTKPPLPGIAQVTKPIANNCNCFDWGSGFPSKFIRVGRYGQWIKGVLSHHAYETAAWL